MTSKLVIKFLYMIFFLKDTTYAEGDLGNKIADSQFSIKRLLSEKENVLLSIGGGMKNGNCGPFTHFSFLFLFVS